jgi:hypothetical protein
MFNAYAAVTACFAVQRPVIPGHHLRFEAAVGHAQDIFMSDIAAGQDTLAAEDTFGHIAGHIGVGFLGGIETGRRNIEARCADLIVGGQLMQLAVPGIGIIDTVAGMGGKHKLHYHLTGGYDLRRMSIDNHTFRQRSMARTGQRLGPLDLHYTDATGPCRELVFDMAQGRYLDPGCLSSLKNSSPFPDPDLFPINTGIHITHLHTSKEEFPAVKPDH